jgi:hypothetical protein
MFNFLLISFTLSESPLKSFFEKREVINRSLRETPWRQHESNRAIENDSKERPRERARERERERE